MVDHDNLVGDMLNYLDQLGIANDTWPDGAMTPFRSEKNTNWEGAFRVPMLVRWPGKIKAGTVSTEIIQHHDYLSDDGDVLGMRYDNWKVVFMEQRCVGTMQVWAEPFMRLPLPKLFNLRTDPYERADITSNTYYNWFPYHDYILFAAYGIADKWAATVKEFPPVQQPNSFTIDAALKMMSESAMGGHGTEAPDRG